jgi:hypothetical protein
LISNYAKRPNGQVWAILVGNMGVLGNCTPAAQAGNAEDLHLTIARGSSMKVALGGRMRDTGFAGRALIVL